MYGIILSVLMFVSAADLIEAKRDLAEQYCWDSLTPMQQTQWITVDGVDMPARKYCEYIASLFIDIKIGELLADPKKEESL